MLCGDWRDSDLDFMKKEKPRPYLVNRKEAKLIPMIADGLIHPVVKGRRIANFDEKNVLRPTSKD